MIGAFNDHLLIIKSQFLISPDPSQSQAEELWSTDRVGPERIPGLEPRKLAPVVPFGPGEVVHLLGIHEKI